MKKKCAFLPVILSGGTGSRLWPLSQEYRPKPFIKLNDNLSLIQKAYLRAAELTGVKEIITVTNRSLLFPTKDEYLEVIKNDITHTLLLEPLGRNTTAAISIAAEYAFSKYSPETTLLILPADHLIKNSDAFAEAVNKAINLAENGKLVTFGIKPDTPKTGFGYIESSGNNVQRYVEKPDIKTAEDYVSSGRYLWNSGMFCMTIRDFRAELKSLCPEIAEQAIECFNNALHLKDSGWNQYEIQQKHFEYIQNISIDYAIFEKSKNIAVVPCDIGWSDIGSWLEFGAMLPLDNSNNRIIANTILDNTNDCIVYGDNNKLIATLGIENLIIADTKNALLIAHKNRSQDIGKIINKLQENTSKEFSTVYRPWGNYTILLEGLGFKIKNIVVNPNAYLSLQSHKHRNEHWIVTSGIATVTNGDKNCQLKSDESTYIPAGQQHRLGNQGDTPLTVIEVQFGDYLGEDDIIRYQDLYGRECI